MTSKNQAKIVQAFHASPCGDVTEFHSLSHFGSEKAARDRASAGAFEGVSMTLYEVELNLGNVLVVPDLNDAVRNSSHSWMRLVDQLHYLD